MVTFSGGLLGGSSHLGDLLTMVINHLLTGIILRVGTWNFGNCTPGIILWEAPIELWRFGFCFLIAFRVLGLDRWRPGGLQGEEQENDRDFQAVLGTLGFECNFVLFFPEGIYIYIYFFFFHPYGGERLEIQDKENMWQSSFWCKKLLRLKEKSWRDRRLLVFLKRYVG